jgi:hypothetical protein
MDWKSLFYNEGKMGGAFIYELPVMLKDDSATIKRQNK